MTGFSGVGKFAHHSGAQYGHSDARRGGHIDRYMSGWYHAAEGTRAIRCAVGSTMQEVDAVPDQYLSFRCEVQAQSSHVPHARGCRQCVGVPVSFEVTTEDMQSPAAYKLFRRTQPGVLPVFDRGPLGAKEKVTVQATFTAPAWTDR